MNVPRWPGSVFSLGIYRCRILWFRVLLGGLALATPFLVGQLPAAFHEPVGSSAPAERVSAPAASAQDDRHDGEIVLEFYDVADLLNEPPQYPAPHISLPPPDAQVAGGSAGGGFCFDDGEEEECAAGISPDELLERVEAKLAPLPPDGSLELSADILIVRQPLAGQEKVVELIRALRTTPE